MKKVLHSLFFLLMFILFGCEKIETHEHTFDISWSYNESSHWHNASCEHTDIVSSFSSHTFDDNGKCIVCGFEKEIETITHNVLFINTMTKDVETLVVEEGSFIQPIDDLVVNGYTFNGWVDSFGNNFGLKSSSSWLTYEVNEDTYLYSSFSPNKVKLKIKADSFLGEFDINIDDEDYINEFDDEVEIGTVIKIKAKPFEFATFNGWKDDSGVLSDELIYSFTVSNMDYNIELSLLGKEYNLIINKYNCEVTANAKYKAGDLVQLESIPSVIGFTFDGYYDSEDNILSNDHSYSFRMPGKDLEINAKAFGRKHTITMHLTREGYDQVIVPIDNVVIEKYAGDEFLLVPPTLRGFTCLSGSTLLVMPEKDLEFTFQYKPIVYNITYCNRFGGPYTGSNIADLPKTYTVLDTVALPNPYIESPYIVMWSHWYLDSECSGDSIVVINTNELLEDLVLYANVTYWNDDQKMECAVRYIDDTGRELASPVSLGKLAYNQIISGYEIKAFLGYELSNNAYGSRMGITNGDTYYIDVVYNRATYDIVYKMVFSDGSIETLSEDSPEFIPFLPGEPVPLKEYKYSSNDTLYVPDVIRNGHIASGLYLDRFFVNEVTNVSPTWTGDKILYIKMEIME